MAIPQSWQHIHAFGGDDFRIRRWLKCAHRPNGGDALVFDDDHAVGQRMTTKTVNEAPTHQCKRTCLSRCEDETEGKRSDEVCVHEMKRLTNQIVLKLMFKLKIGGCMHNQESSIGQVNPSAPQFPRGNSHPTIIIWQSVITITAQ